MLFVCIEKLTNRYVIRAELSTINNRGWSPPDGSRAIRTSVLAGRGCIFFFTKKKMKTHKKLHPRFLPITIMICRSGCFTLWVTLRKAYCCLTVSVCRAKVRHLPSYLCNILMILSYASRYQSVFGVKIPNR